ncbi:hypothetical protein Bca52824_029029 [Brassica carinata]|uniref:Phorbol-ester/DAG-type domain-containing protein n=1 Tax=Brassica carinata TaxID=52824 RepID=A0A8X7VDI8_BRACI|nr:hypothetical protein Bca52824_029029 [Brassica carinata]
MSSLRSEIKHFTHIHPLTKVDNSGKFKCNGCKTYGIGKSYRCSSCDYDLHEYCAICPPTLLSFMHPKHKLKLVFKEPAMTNQDRRGCNICHELIEGLNYQCEACGFDMHPICSQLPQNVTHVPHPAHPLELSHQGASNTCNVCHGAIRSWRYKCDPCRLDVHMECVNSSASAARGIQQRSFGTQPYFQRSNQYQQPYFQPSHQYQQPYFQPSQYQQPGPYFQPYHGYNYGYTNQGQPHGHQPSVLSMGEKMFNVLMALTVGVASQLIADTLGGSLDDTDSRSLGGSSDTKSRK